MDDDITNINDNISDEEILSCVKTIEKEQESVTNPPECRPETKQPENPRFALLTDEDLTTLISSAEAKGTKKNTKWIVATIEGKYIFKKKQQLSVRTQFETSLLFSLYSQSGAVNGNCPLIC